MTAELVVVPDPDFVRRCFWCYAWYSKPWYELIGAPGTYVCAPCGDELSEREQP